MIRVLAFGVFDLLHPGHIAFLKQAKRLGDGRTPTEASELVVVVTRDEVVEREKGRKPKLLAKERVTLITGVRWVDRAVIGDPPSKYFSVIRRFRPDVIAVGYDQPCNVPAFRVMLRSLGLPRTRVVRLKEHRGHRYHSSVLAAPPSS